ncbi:MAG: aminopeptidase N [Actinomycetaceae bacterium]|nr:aminopeptidase N [Actinomycetaceae bacterium]
MPGKNLTREEALARAEVATVNAYEIELDLTNGDQTFFSRTVIDFDATEGAATFVDLISPNVHSIELNGQQLDPLIHQDSRIQLTGLAAHNRLVVAADCEYMHTGEGMHRFTDPADGKSYVYTQFEVPDARRVFAVFEQPDLKATFQFTVTVPQQWKVFSNAITPEPQVHEGGWTYRFSPSEKISSYITAIVAGPYEGVTDSLVSADGREIPLGVYTRASLLPYLDSEDILGITKQGFAFYENMYDRPYPFTKYDQIFVPEYNAGAMENAGCVTYRDEFLFRITPTRAQLSDRANVILHELAHMWFGDLVTMKWWNDLWLNESFAEFMSHLAMAEATEYTEAWIAFGARKAWGISQDQLPSTHPVAAEIRDLADIEVNFDGITYAKGAAMLRQLVAFVGREAFERGLRAYFQQFAWQNTELTDLLTKLQEASGRDLGEWAKVWVQEHGITVLRTRVITGEDGRIRDLTVLQETPQAGTSVRPHRMVVGGYNLQDGQLVRTNRWELDVDGEQTPVSEAIGMARPDVIVLNDEDLTYAKIRLDQESLAFATEQIGAFADPLARAVVMASLWDACRDGELPAREYVEIALTSLATETDSDQRALVCKNLVVAATSYTNPAERDALTDEWSHRLHVMAVAQPAGADSQKQLLLTAVALAKNDQVQWLKDLLSGKAPLSGIAIEGEVRWNIVSELAALGAISENAIAAELERDDTLTGRQFAAGAKAALPPNRIEAMQKALNDTSIPNGTLEQIITAIRTTSWRNPADGAFVPTYFASLTKVWESFTFHIAELVVNGLFPDNLVGVEGLDVIGTGRQWLADNVSADTALRRCVIECLDTAERKHRCQDADVVN